MHTDAIICIIGLRHTIYQVPDKTGSRNDFTFLPEMAFKIIFQKQKDRGSNSFTSASGTDHNDKLSLIRD